MKTECTVKQTTYLGQISPTYRYGTELSSSVLQVAQI